MTEVYLQDVPQGRRALFKKLFSVYALGSNKTKHFVKLRRRKFSNWELPPFSSNESASLDNSSTSSR